MDEEIKDIVTKNDDEVILKKIIGHGSLQFKNGMLTVWNIPTLLIPLNTYLLLNQTMMDRFGDDARDMFYYLIKNQAMSGMEVLEKQFGFKDMKQLVQYQLGTSALMGVGPHHLVRFDEKNKIAIIKIEPNPVAEVSRKLFGTVEMPVDHFARGGMAGIFSYAFKTDVVAIETSCKACGKNECIIEVKPRDAWDLTNPEISAQMPKDEKEYVKNIRKVNAKDIKLKE